MNGFFIGDIIGNSYTHENEKYNKKTKNFKFFTNRSKFSDDTIMTFATMDWLLHTNHSTKEAIDCLKKFYNLFPDRTPTIYGESFVNWVKLDSYKFSKSKGNGGAMRCSPIAYYANSIREINEYIIKGITPTHNTYTGKMGAKIVCHTIFYIRNGKNIDDIKKMIANIFNIKIDVDIDEFRKNFTFTFDSIETVRAALIAFINSTSFEDAIRNAVSLGGDTDTITSITSAIAESYYKEIDTSLIKKCKEFLPNIFINLLDEFNAYIIDKEKQKIKCG